MEQSSRSIGIDSIQETQYAFPYHYLAHIDKNGVPRVSRGMSWGMEYLEYTRVVKELIDKYGRPDGSILDVGCGDGSLLNTISLSCRKVGVDYSERSIAFAKAFASSAEFLCGSVEAVSDRFGVVTCIEVLEHVPDNEIKDFLDGIIRALDRGGYLIISVPSTVQKLNSKHYRHYNEALLSQQMDCERRGLVELEVVRAYRCSYAVRFLEMVAYNRLYCLNSGKVLSVISRLHRYLSSLATKQNGGHIIGVYQLNTEC